MEECSQHCQIPDSLESGKAFWFLLLFSVCVYDGRACIYGCLHIYANACMYVHVHLCMHLDVNVWESPRLY